MRSARRRTCLVQSSCIRGWQPQIGPASPELYESGLNRGSASWHPWRCSRWLVACVSHGGCVDGDHVVERTQARSIPAVCWPTLSNGPTPPRLRWSVSQSKGTAPQGVIQRQYVTVTNLPGYGGSPLARCGESLRSSNRLVSLRGPVRADEAGSHAVKRIAVAARRGPAGPQEAVDTITTADKTSADITAASGSNGATKVAMPQRD
jgi:hypothetical protein